MKREMRRKDRELSKQEAYRLLEKGEWGVLCTFDGEYPYGVPVNYVLLNDHIYFHCATVGHKIDAIKNLSNVCFTVVLSSEVIPSKLTTKYESVIAFGKAKIVDGEEKVEALRALGRKFSKDYIETVENEIAQSISKTLVVAVKIEEITAKANRLNTAGLEPVS